MADPNDPWAAFNPQSASPSPQTAPAPAFGGRPVIQEGPPQHEPKTTYRTLTPDEVKERGLAPAVYQVDSNGQVSKVGDAPDANNMSKDAAMEATRQLIGSIEKARGYVNDAQSPVGNTATGLGYNLLRHSPIPTDASQLDATIKGEVQGNIFQQWMNSMKASVAEQGGSAFGGRILQSEIPFIVNSKGALTPGQLHTPEFLKNLTQVETSVIRSAAMLNNENPDDPAVMAKYTQMFKPPTADGSGNGPQGGDAPPKNDQELVQQLQDRVRRGDDPADTIHWLVSINRPPDKKTIAQIIAGSGSASTIVDPPHDPNGGGGGLGHSFAVGLGGVAQGVGDLAGVVSNPFIQGYDALTGSNIRPDMGANLRDTLGLPAPQNNQEQFINRVNDYGTQALGLGGLARAAAPFVTPVSQVIGNALAKLGSAPLTDSAAGASGGAASDITRQTGGGPLAQTAAGVVAGLPAIAAGGRLNALMGETSAAPPVLAAGKQEGVTVPRAMAYQSMEPKLTATGKTMAGAKIMGAQMRVVGNQIEGRVKALGGDGVPLDTFNAGETAQNIGKRYIQTSGQQFSRQYDRLRQATEGVTIQPQQATTQIDGIISRLNAAPQTNAAEIKYLEGLKSDLSSGLSVDTARDIGSKLSADIRKGAVTFGKAERDVLDIRKAVSADVANGLSASGKAGVAAQFKNVDAAYQQRMEFIQNTIQKLTGPRDRPMAPEQAASRIQAWASAKGDSGSLAKIMAQATPEEKADIASTFADSLGKNRKGEFSTAILANSIERLSPRARQIIFGSEGAKSIENISTLAKEHARTMRALGGSPTALAGDARSWVMNLLFGGGGAGLAALEGGGLTHSALAGAATSGTVAGAKLARDVFSARSLMSPKITGWLRSAPRSSDPAAINAWADRLKAIAVREPALAPEVKSIQDSLLHAANENVTPAAAASQPDQGN